MSTNNNHEKSKVTYTGEYCEVCLIQISNKQFDEYKTIGLPSAKNDAKAWEKYITKLEESSSGSMLYSDDFKLTLKNADNPKGIDLKKTHPEIIKNTLPICLATEAKNKFHLIRLRITQKAKYYFELDGVVEINQLKLSVKPEQLPGGQVLNSLMIEYGDELFSYDRKSIEKFTSTEIYLVDSKGNAVLL